MLRGSRDPRVWGCHGRSAMRTPWQVPGGSLGSLPVGGGGWRAGHAGCPTWLPVCEQRQHIHCVWQRLASTHQPNTPTTILPLEHLSSGKLTDTPTHNDGRPLTFLLAQRTYRTADRPPNHQCQARWHLTKCQHHTCVRQAGTGALHVACGFSRATQQLTWCGAVVVAVGSPTPGSGTEGTGTRAQVDRGVQVGG